MIHRTERAAIQLEMLVIAYGVAMYHLKFFSTLVQLVTMPLIFLVAYIAWTSIFEEMRNDALRDHR